MIGETHKRIARMVSNQLKLNPKEASLLENGSTAPDIWQDFPHHQGKESEIIENIIQAHSLFLKNDDECYHKLGIALHYIQDRWTSRPRISDAHTKWERKIDLSKYWEDNDLKKIIDAQTLPLRRRRHILNLLLY